MKKILMIIFIIGLVITQSITAYAESSTLNDIKGHWAEDDIKNLYSKGIITGNEKGNYEPDKAITRAEFVALITRFIELRNGLSTVTTELPDTKSFNDIGYDKYWCKTYIETAVAKGYIIPSEIGDIFNGNTPITRTEMAMIAARAIHMPIQANVGNPYSDIETPNDYISMLYYERIMEGYKSGDRVLFKPFNNATKAEAVTVLLNIAQWMRIATVFEDQKAIEEYYNVPQPDDILAKIEIEKQKQAQSNTYIMEPVLTIEYNTDPYRRFYFDIYFDNLTDYSDECEYKIECVNYPQLNVIDMAMMDGTYKRYDLSSWRPLGSEHDNIRSSIYRLGSKYYTTQDNTKTFKIKPGMKLDFKFTIVRGNETKVVYKSVIVNDINFK